MKKFFFAIITVLALSSCTNNGQNNDILPDIPVNETIDLNLPSYVDLVVPGGWAYTSGGISGIIVYNINGTQFKAFERSADIHAKNITVSADGHTVTLRGTVSSISEKDEAEKAAFLAPGVYDVKNELRVQYYTEYA